MQTVLQKGAGFKKIWKHFQGEQLSTYVTELRTQANEVSNPSERPFLSNNSSLSRHTVREQTSDKNFEFGELPTREMSREMNS